MGAGGGGVSAVEHRVGDIVLVRAWWLNGATVECQVKKANLGGEYKWYDVQPLTGNPHWRSVRPDAVIGPGAQGEGA